MERLCAWCFHEMPPKETGDDNRITHAICPDCAESFRDDIRAHYALEDPQEDENWGC